MVVNGPSSWEVVTATMIPTGTLVVIIKRLPDFVSFLTSPGDANAPAPTAAATSSASPSSSSFAATAVGPAPVPFTPVLPAAAEDPDILALSQSLKALGIGTMASCLKFATALEDRGVLSIERLKKLSVDKAQKGLEEVQISDIQIDTVMLTSRRPSSLRRRPKLWAVILQPPELPVSTRLRLRLCSATMPLRLQGLI